MLKAFAKSQEDSITPAENDNNSGSSSVGNTVGHKFAKSSTSSVTAQHQHQPQHTHTHHHHHHHHANSSPTATMIRECLPKKGYLHNEDNLSFVLCKPKLLPLKSYTIEKLEKIQRESIAKIKESMDSGSLE